jgi:hypothetical protein
LPGRNAVAVRAGSAGRRIDTVADIGVLHRKIIRRV